jgi:hypothetical protein
MAVLPRAPARVAQRHQSNGCQTYMPGGLSVLHGLAFGRCHDLILTYESVCFRSPRQPVSLHLLPHTLFPLPGPFSVMITPIPSTTGALDQPHPSIDLTLGAIEIGALLSTL